jgi:2-polyprenyl-3-methyl-5-hydroxy-6-metoxy-1,4-benzoquinol methylase/uncharacterized membrane protein YbhN (UPF0104 family)
MIVSDTLANQAVPPRAVPRPTLWLVLIAGAIAMLAIGLVTSAVILGRANPDLSAVPAALGGAVAIGLAATGASLAMRTFRWMFLLRRTGVRIPLRDACIGYLSGLSLLFVPFLVGEIGVRAAVQKSRAAVPLVITSAVNLWERFLDVSALALIASVGAGVLAGPAAAVIPLTIVAASATRSFRLFMLALAVGVSDAAVRRIAPLERSVPAAEFTKLASYRIWLSALAASVAAWVLPALALWAAANSWGRVLRMADAQFAYASSALTGGLLLAPGGIRIVGTSLISYLTIAGLSASQAALTVLAVRLATAGFATVLGAMFAWTHWRTRPLTTVTHFDDIADAYDAQISPAQREALLTRKTALMADVLRSSGGGGRGLDVGCGQGWYVARMRQLGFEVHGVDTSARQVAAARRNVGDPRVIETGSVLTIPAADHSYDFAYCINVLHHLASEAEQRRAFAELFRVLRPGGLLFVHEINTRNLLFRFYMGYVFPSLNCIDEGTERWLLPHRLARFTDVPIRRIDYFTFMPEFVPRLVLRLLRPIEALLEASPLRIYSAHYMAVLQKPAPPA